MSDPILLALIRQLLRQGQLSDMDVQGMAADLDREGHPGAAHSVNVLYIEACALEEIDGAEFTAGQMAKIDTSLGVIQAEVDCSDDRSDRVYMVREGDAGKNVQVVSVATRDVAWLGADIFGGSGR